MKAENIPICDKFFTALKNEPFLTAHECSELFEMTPQKASAVLRSMESDGLISAKKIKAGRGEVKCYFILRKDN